MKNQHYFNAYPGLVNELIENHLHRGSQEQRREVKRLINSLMQGSQTSAVEFITLLQVLENFLNFWPKIFEKEKKIVQEKYRVCRNKGPGRLIFRSNKKYSKTHQYPVGFVYSPL